LSMSLSKDSRNWCDNDDDHIISNILRNHLHIRLCYV
jgi:hypothetical protein